MLQLIWFVFLKGEYFITNCSKQFCPIYMHFISAIKYGKQNSIYIMTLVMHTIHVCRYAHNFQFGA